MPMHNWKRVPATINHHFHQRWTIAICDALNAGMLPEGYSAHVEQDSCALYPDLLAVQRPSPKPPCSQKETMTLAPPSPRTRMVVQPREGRFHERANRITIRDHLGEVLSVRKNVRGGMGGLPSGFSILRRTRRTAGREPDAGLDGTVRSDKGVQRTRVARLACRVEMIV
jgi:hypothetical protein